MPRQKQAAPSRGGAYAKRNAAARARAAEAAARDAGGEGHADAEEAEDTRPTQRRRVASDARVALLPRLSAAPGALRVGAISLTWHGAVGEPDALVALRLRGAAGDEDDGDERDNVATAHGSAAPHGGASARTPFVAEAVCGADAAPALRGTLSVSRSAADALSTLTGAGLAAAALSPDGALLRVALLPAAFADEPASPTEGGASAAHGALRVLLPLLLAGGARPPSAFEAAELFARLRRAGGQALPPTLRGLKPTLRPYQARAAAWLVAREKGAPEAQWPPGATHPLWQRVVPPADADDDAATVGTTPHGAPPPAEGPSDAAASAFYFCEATGRLSRAPFAPPQLPRGGILADEMGLGKTVELLALVCAHPFVSGDAHSKGSDAAADASGGAASEAEAVPPWRADRVACACGEDPFDFEGLWVQCGACLAWSHAPCVHYRPPRRKRGRSDAAAAPDGDAASDFECGRCRAWRAAAPLRARCGSTLVVCPSPLVEQWRRELLRHVSAGDGDGDDDVALRVRVYGGQSQKAGGPGGHGAAVVTAAELASYDVVITSYDVLRAELHRGSHVGVDDSGGRAVADAAGVDDDSGAMAQFGRASRRGGGDAGKRYSVVPTPLTRLTWWRVVCDEAQAVESSAASATAMVRRLRATHRWAVTGTPLGRGGVDDVAGLLAFLDAPPLADAALFRAAVARRAAAGDGAGAAAALAACIAPLFWRTSRAEAEAARELALPPQGALLTRLALSPLERHWYAQQHSRCAADAARALRGGGDDAAARDRPLPHAQLQALLRGPLLRLRQACDHPQVGAGGLTAGAGGGVLTMAEIHARLAERARAEAEEAQRALALNLNALAAHALIRADADAAAQLYRTVLALEHALDAPVAVPDAAPDAAPGEQLRLDPLQRLHALRNLEAALGAGAGGGPACGLEERAALRRDADVIAEAYLAPHVARAAAAARDLARASAAADPTALPPGTDGWWLVALGRAARSADGGAALAMRLRDAVQERWQDAVVPFRDCSGAQAALAAALRDIGEARRALLAASNALQRATDAASDADVWAAGHCAACRGGAGVAGVRCRHCAAADGPFAAAENVLFGRQVKISMPGRHVEEADVGAGRSAPSSAETCLRALAGWAARADNGCADVAEAARAHVEQLEAMRREFARASAAMLAQRISLAARDELAMAATRLRLRTAAEAVAAGGRDPVPLHLRSSVLHPHEAVAAEAAAREARVAHEAELAAARAQLRWLRSLRQRDAAAEVEDAAAADAPSAAGEDVCPVCHDALRAGHTSVLPCGHQLCVRCTMALAARARGAAAAAAAAAVAPARAAAAPPPPPVRLSCPKCRRTAPSDQIFTVADNRGDADAATPAAAGNSAAAAAAPAAGVLSVTGTCPGRGESDPAAVAARAFAAEVAAGEAALRVRGSWGTKLDAVVRRVLFLAAREPGAKVLLFSEWVDVFVVLEQALAANGVSFLRAGGPASAKGGRAKAADPNAQPPPGGDSAPATQPSRGRKAAAAPRGPGAAAASAAAAIAAFQAGADVTALLLPVSRGANGLNLVEARHVIMIEPLLDAGAEAQAIKRVDRIGQVAATWVHRFVVARSVEDNIHGLVAHRVEAAAAARSDAAPPPAKAALSTNEVVSLLRT